MKERYRIRTMSARKPTEKQILCVAIIVNNLDIGPPTEFTKAAYSDFISEYMAESRKKTCERRHHTELDAGDSSALDAFLGGFTGAKK